MSQKIDISIISSGASLADARLHRLTRALLRAGLSVEIFAPGNPKDAPSQTSKLLIRKPFFTSHWKISSLGPRYFRSRYFVFRSKGRVIYAISPEAIAPSFAFAKLVRRKLAVDFFEDYLRLLNDRAWTKRYFGIIGWIAKLKIPVMIIQGTTDIQVSMDDANRLARALPKAKLVKIEGMNHILKPAPADRQMNIATYTQPDLPLKKELAASITPFILSN